MGVEAVLMQRRIATEHGPLLATIARGWDTWNKYVRTSSWANPHKFRFQPTFPLPSSPMNQNYLMPTPPLHQHLPLPPLLELPPPPSLPMSTPWPRLPPSKKEWPTRTSFFSSSWVRRIFKKGAWTCRRTCTRISIFCLCVRFHPLL